MALIKDERRLGLQCGADIPDSLLVAEAMDGDFESGRRILQRCYVRLRDVAATTIEKKVVKFFDDYGYGETAPKELDNCPLPFDICDAESCVRKNAEHFGSVFAAYLLARFSSFDDETSVSIAFNLRQAKNTGRSTDRERDMEIAEGVRDLLQQIEKGTLHRGIGRFLSDKTHLLPTSIEDLIKLREFRDSHKYIPEERMRLAQFVVSETGRLQNKEQETGKAQDHLPLTLAANTFAECSKACAQQIDQLMDRLKERRNTLLAYGAGPLRKNNTSGNATGIREVYKKNRAKLPEQNLRQAPSMTFEDALRLIAIDDPTVRQAIALIESPDVGNHTRPALQELQQKTPDNFKFIWPELWQSFQSAALQRQREKDQSDKQIEKD
jgi:hypothetical protein